MATRSAKTAQICCVTIGYRTYLLPIDKGMKLVELMASALECSEQYAGGRMTYTPGEAPRVEFTTVKPDQITTPLAPAPIGKRTKALTHNPSDTLL